VFCNLKKISKGLKKTFVRYVRFHEEKDIYDFLKNNKKLIIIK